MLHTVATQTWCWKRMLVEFGIWQGRKEKAKQNSKKGDQSERQLSNDLVDVFVYH